MSEFKVIETQEELDRIVGSRLAREREKYADYDQLVKRVDQLETEKGGLLASLEEFKRQEVIQKEDRESLQAQLKAEQTKSLRTQVALKNGLSFDMADRLRGETEEELEADAQFLVDHMVPSRYQTPPQATKEVDVSEDRTRQGLKELLENLNLKGE